MDSLFVMKGLWVFKNLFGEELKKTPSNINEMSNFLNQILIRFGKNFKIGKVLKKLHPYLNNNKLTFTEYFNKVKDNEAFYRYLNFLSKNNEPFTLPLEWMKSKLSKKYLNMEVAHKIGKELLSNLIQTKNKESREVVWKSIFQKICDNKIWAGEEGEQNISFFKRGAEVFGYEAMFRYLGTHENIHEALFNIEDIIRTAGYMGIGQRFLDLILFQVPQDKSVDYEGNNSYHRFNQCVKAFVEMESSPPRENHKYENWRKTLKEESEISDPAFLKLKEALLKNEIGYKSFNGFQKLIQTMGIISRKNILRKLELIKQRGNDGKKIYDYFSYLLFHPSLKNTTSVEQFLENPETFLGIKDGDSIDELHESKKPSQFLEFPFIDLKGEELRDALILGKLDDIAAFKPMKIDFYSYLDTEGLPILIRKMKFEWESWLFNQDIFDEESFKIKLKDQINVNNRLKGQIEKSGLNLDQWDHLSIKEILNAIQKSKIRLSPRWLIEKGVLLKEPYKHLQEELVRNELPLSFKQDFRK